MQTSTLTAAAAAVSLAAAINAAGSFRLTSLVRAYAVSSLALAALVMALAVTRGIPGLYWLAASTLLLKVLAIPWIMLREARLTGMSQRLLSYVRPAPTYLGTLMLVGIVVAVAARSPFFKDADPGYLLVVSVAMSVVGLAMMVVRRDLMSQVSGFLVLENGIAMFAYCTVRDLPFMMELGILMALTVGVLLMSILSRRVRELYGNESTESLRELTD